MVDQEKHNDVSQEIPSIIQEPRDELAHKSQRVSVYMSLAGLSLMIAGFIYTFLISATLTIPGASALTLLDLHHLQMNHTELGMLVMSAGILVLALLPMVRVVLALWIYVKQRNVTGGVTALMVLLELIASTQAG